MRIKVILFAAAISVAATNSFAGGLAASIAEAPVVQTEVVAPAQTSIDPTYIVVGVLAALVIAAAISADDDGDDDTVDEPDGGGQACAREEHTDG